MGDLIMLLVSSIYAASVFTPVCIEEIIHLARVVTALESAAKTLTTTTRLQHIAEQILETTGILKSLVDEASNVVYTMLCSERVRTDADIMTLYYIDRVKHLAKSVSTFGHVEVTS
ncbi:hypothetical protein LshimejAT787_1202700 [Lyophyllum shimeji]|uniref:Uncharacterized protein n=1 Tax=Lyophyllum shimeji TaxID=47721 RepID=A0A9P3UU46_LYOSH|nr:hypothetical protein LshimejAT787_1202700 [Lyophyllum shimeji]